jgi:hypothetical protein
MRLPDIPLRHQRLVRTVATAGTGALALVRRRDVVADNEHLLRLGTALADAGLTWLTGSTAYLGKTAGSSGIRDVVEAFAPADSGPVRYSRADDRHTHEGALPDSYDSDAWWDEHADVWSPAFLNAATAVATGAVSWALWPMAQRIAEAVDAKLPPGVGRGLGAAVSGGLVALTAAGIDAIETWAEDDEESDWGPVEIELPTHIRESVELLLSQPHPVSPAGAEAVREQFDSAQFFVWVTYPNSLRSGDEPIALDPQQVTELLDGEDVTWIDVRPAASTPTAVPATQTYPVSGTTDGGSPNDDGLTSGGGSTSSARLSLDIVDGRLRRLGLSDMDDEAGDMLTPAALRDSVPGTLHPEKDDDITGCSCSDIGACDEEARTLERWPHPEDLTVRVDGQRADREHAGGE